MSRRDAQANAAKFLLGMTLLSALVSACKPSDPPLAGPPQAPAAQLQGPTAAPQAPAKPKPFKAPTPEIVKPTPPPPIKIPSVIKLQDLAAAAWEDVFPYADDQDFNDFLCKFMVHLKVDDDHNITNITIDFYPQAVGASFDHKLLMVLNGVKDGTGNKRATNITHITDPLVRSDGKVARAKVTLTHYDISNYTDQQRAAGVLPPVLDSTTPDPDHDITIFANTHNLFADPANGSLRNNYFYNFIINTEPSVPFYRKPTVAARLEIKVKQPELNPYVGDGRTIDFSKYRMILHVIDGIKHASPDIDLVDVDPTALQDPTKRLAAPAGKTLKALTAEEISHPYPHGFIIPANWKWPVEGKNISEAYPAFNQYKRDLTDRMINAKVNNNHITAQPFQWYTSSSTWYNTEGNKDAIYQNAEPVIQLPDPR